MHIDVEITQKLQCQDSIGNSKCGMGRVCLYANFERGAKDKQVMSTYLFI